MNKDFHDTLDKINKMNMAELKEYFIEENLPVLYKLKSYLDDIYYNTGETTVEDIKYDLLKDIIKIKDPKYIPVIGAKLNLLKKIYCLDGEKIIILNNMLLVLN